MDSVVSIRVGQSQGNHVTLCEEAPFDTGSLATMRVLEPPSEGWMEDEAVGIVGCALSYELLTPRDGLSVEITRVNKGQLVKYKGELKRVREVTEVALSCLSPRERCIAEKMVGRKGREQLRKNISSSLWVANESLSKSDFWNRKRAILHESQETLNLGWAGRCWIYETLVGFNSRRVGTWLLGTISVALLFCMCICTVWDGGVGPVVGRIGGDRSQSTCASMCGGRFQHGVASS
ncbi:hypothetical protein V6N13_009421 [Hibiscus sabdariffa]